MERLEYKGVDVNQEAKIDLKDTANRLVKGMGPVGFKKKGSATYKKAKKKQNRWTS